MRNNSWIIFYFYNDLRLKIILRSKWNNKFDYAFWYNHVFKIKNQRFDIKVMLDKDDYLLKKTFFLRWLKSHLIRVHKKYMYMYIVKENKIKFWVCFTFLKTCLTILSEIKKKSAIIFGIYFVFIFIKALKLSWDQKVITNSIMHSGIIMLLK